MLRMFIEQDQERGARSLPDICGSTSLQTGVFAGLVESAIGQRRFREGIIVLEAQCKWRSIYRSTAYSTPRPARLDHP